MELPRRDRGDELLKPGELTALRARLQELAPKHDLATVVAYAFDHRTRALPFIGTDLRMAPAGARAIGAAMVASGFEKTRVVLQQWNANFRPSEMKLDGRTPDIFLASSMSLHMECCHEMVADAMRIDEAQRPLVVVGGPNSFYKPWTSFRAEPGDPAGPDVVVTGEEFVWLSLLELLLTERGTGETIRQSFLRVRDRGLLDTIPGLYYAHTEDDGVALELVDTGVQRLLGDLDELPHPEIGYRLLEPPSRKTTIGSHALTANRVKKHSPVSSLVLTFGCKFRCPYCPIPAYNQRQYRVKSPERIADEMTRLKQQFDLSLFFGADDNFFNNHERTLEIAEVLARTEIDGKPIRHQLRWGTEATVHDTLQIQEHLPLLRRASLRALWLGVEDLTATFVKKGQDVDKTIHAFQLLKKARIFPMPMMMHHDGQPLYTRGSPYGLLNQIQILRKAGAITVQVLMMTPAPGSTLYEEAFTKSIAFKSVNGRTIGPNMTDANFVLASEEERPWHHQINMLIAYLFFYNPVRFVLSVLIPKRRFYLTSAAAQLHGMWGLLYTMRRTLPWAWHLFRGKIVRHTVPPVSKIPMRSAGGGRASHALNAQADEGGCKPDLVGHAAKDARAVVDAMP